MYGKDCGTKLVTLSIMVEFIVWGRFMTVKNIIHYPFVPLEI